MSTRAERLQEHRSHLGFPPETIDRIFGPTDDAGGRIRPVLLVEMSFNDEATYFTTHDTAEQAVAYHLGQGARDDWRIAHLVNVDTGETYTVEAGDETFVATTGCVTQTIRHTITTHPSTGDSA